MAAPPPTLSVCMATFNRGAFLGETLESIVSQATDEVEIVIVDGGSTDNTGEVAERFRDRFPNLRYIRQETNGGVDRDFNRAVELANGKYCWLMSDDDPLKAGAVQAVLEATRGGFGLIVVNAEARTHDLSEVLVERRLPLETDVVYPPEESGRFFAELAEYLSFISSTVIRRDIWLRRDRESYFGSFFIHIGVIFQKPLAEAVKVLARPLIVNRIGNAMWTPRSFEIWRFRWPELIWSFPGYTERAKRKVCPKEPWRSPASLLMSRGMGTYGTVEYDRLIRPRIGSIRGRFSPYLIARLPGPLVNLLGLFVFTFVYRRSHFGLVVLRASPYHYRNWHGLFSRRRDGSPVH